jgi:hypothetical protein
MAGTVDALLAKKGRPNVQFFFTPLLCAIIEEEFYASLTFKLKGTKSIFDLRYKWYAYVCIGTNILIPISRYLPPTTSAVAPYAYPTLVDHSAPPPSTTTLFAFL